MISFKRLLSGIVATAMTVSLCSAMAVSLFAEEANVTAPTLENLEDDGMILHHITPHTEKPVLDGVVNEDEYLTSMTMDYEGGNCKFSDWTPNGLTEDQILEAIPDEIKMYVSYDKDGLYIATTVTEPRHYNPVWSWQDMWTGDCFCIDVAVDNDRTLMKGEYSFADYTDYPRICAAIIDDGSTLTPLAGYSSVSTYSSGIKVDRTDLSKDPSVISCKKDGTTVTYEIFMSWKSLWGNEEAPASIYMNYQYHLAEPTLEEFCEDGYGACVGGLRYAFPLDDSLREKYGIDKAQVFYPYFLDYYANVNDGTYVPGMELETETETEAEKMTLEKDNVLNNWGGDVATLFRSGGNQTNITVTEEGLELTWLQNDIPDPYFTFPVFNYYKRFTNDAPAPANCNYVVLKLKATDCDGTMEVYAQAVADDCGYGDYEANGEWQYVIVDMSFTSLPESRKLNTIRIDWATQPGENAKMVIGELGFFATEAEAYAYAGIEMPTEPATTEKVTEPEVTTESDSTVESATDAQSADIVDDAGCVSVVTGSAAILLVAAAAAVACKKKKA